MDLENTENIIRIQRNIRGFLARKRLIGSNEAYYRVVLKKILRKLNNFEHFYDFYPGLAIDREGGIEDQAPGPGASFRSGSKCTEFEESKLDSDKTEEKEVKLRKNLKLATGHPEIKEQRMKSSENNEEFLNIRESLEGDLAVQPVETLVFEADKKIVMNFEEVFEDYMPASFSYMIIVEDFIERVVVPIRFKVICDCFDMKFEGVEKVEVKFAKPCCDIAVLEKVVNNDKLVKGLREEAGKKEGIQNRIEDSLAGIVKEINNIEKFEEVSSNLSYSSSLSEISPIKKSQNNDFIEDNKVGHIIQKTDSKHGMKKTQAEDQFYNENLEKVIIKDEKIRSLLENKNKDEELKINPVHNNEVDKIENKSDIYGEENEGHEPLFKQSDNVPKIKNDSPKEKFPKGKSKKNLKDLIKKSAPIHSNLNKPSNNSKKLSMNPESYGSRHSPTSQNLQLTTNPPDSKQKPYKNLKVEVQILPFEYNFLNHLGHKREDSKKNDVLEIKKYDFKHKLQKKAKDKFYPYEKWTQVLPKIKKPRITYSSYKDYGFLSDHRCKKETGPGKSGDYRMVSSGSEQNIVKFRRNLPKFSSYKIKLAGNQMENLENKEKNEETEKTPALKLKKGRINDLYNK